LVSQLKNSCTYRRQRPVIAWSLSLLHLPQLKSQVLPDVLREGLKDLSGVSLPGNPRKYGIAHFTRHETNFIGKK